MNLCKRLQARFDVTVLAPAEKGARSRDEIDGVRVRRFHYFWPRSLERLAEGALLENVRHRPWLFIQAPFLLMFELLAAYRFARSHRPAVIHAHWFVPQGIVAVLVGRLLGIPVVVTAHGADVSGLRGWLWSAVRRAIGARCAAMTAVSSDLKRKLEGVVSASGQPPLVMPMGVDSERFGADPAAWADREKIVLFVGRLAEKKGLEYLLRAFPQVSAHHPDARLVVVGDGPLRGKLEALAQNLGLKGNVDFLGGKPPSELPRLYSSCRVFVGPSVVARSGDTEGFGLVFIEAFAAGRPAVASSVGGIPDIVVHGRTGLLVEPGSPDALAAAICELLDSPTRADRMGRVASRWVRRKFDWRSVARGYADLLAKAAGYAKGTSSWDGLTSLNDAAEKARNQR
jgi:glycosyltransferase involved in cell wall biosynthesis